MNRILYPLCITPLVFAASMNAQSVFNGGSIFVAGSWTGGLPAGGTGIINVNGSGSDNQGNSWMNGGTVVIDGGAVLSLGTDLGARGGVLTINNATINANDDIFSGNNGTIIFNAGSAGNTGLVNVDADFQAQAGNAAAPSSIRINGGTHTARRKFGSQNGSNYLAMTGGQITAGEFEFAGTGNSIGGSAMLLSASETTSLTMGGTTNIASDWSGAWSVGSFSGTDWRTELTTIAGWTFGGDVITDTVFDDEFRITNDGTTLSLVPEPSSYAALLGLLALGVVLLQRRKV